LDFGLQATHRVALKCADAGSASLQMRQFLSVKISALVMVVSVNALEVSVENLPPQITKTDAPSLNTSGIDRGRADPEFLGYVACALERVSNQFGFNLLRAGHAATFRP
jgi:hypothetical protein